jgi:hypothetical protein
MRNGGGAAGILGGVAKRKRRKPKPRKALILKGFLAFAMLAPC